MQQPESKPACQDSNTQPLEFRRDGSERQREIYAKMSPSEKWEQVCRLREMAWAMKSARIRSQHPDWSEDQIFHEVKKIFLYAVT